MKHAILKYAILTTIGTAHLEDFGCIENTQKAKFELIETLPDNGIAVLNVENQSVISYGISIFAVCLGALFLLLDFDNIAQLHGRASKDMEWVCGMGLLATLVWLYIELLKLFMKLQSRE